MNYNQQHIFYPCKSTELKANDFLEQESPHIPQYIVRKRMKNEAIARINTVSSRTGELFYLQALLLHRAAYTVVEIRTINGIEFPTFQETAAELGLFENQSEGRDIMKEAVESFGSPSQLHFLFTHISLNIPVNAIELFNDYQNRLSADYLDQFDVLILVIQKCLLDLSYHLESQSARLSNFGLPEPESKVDEIFLEEAAFLDRQEELSDFARVNEGLLLEQQLEA